jgi:nucleoside diphosphate kinase
MEIKAECTLVILKPDLHYRRLVEPLKQEVYGAGLSIVDHFDVWMRPWDWWRFYPNLPPLVRCTPALRFSIQPMTVWIIEGFYSYERMLAIKRSFRRKHRHPIFAGNLLHSSDDHASFERELEIVMQRLARQRTVKVRCPRRGRVPF